MKNQIRLTDLGLDPEMFEKANKHLRGNKIKLEVYDKKSLQEAFYELIRDEVMQAYQHDQAVWKEWLNKVFIKEEDNGKDEEARPGTDRGA